MQTVPIPFELPGFRVDRVASVGAGLVVEGHSLSSEAACPTCASSSTRVHSYYTRSPQDLPLCEFGVTLRLRVRRFRCLNSECERQTFAEQLPEVAPRHAQRTVRVSKRVRDLGLALGGEAGARLAQQSQIDVSGDTVLRTLRQMPAPALPPPRVLGVDDFALRTGRVYGTLLVDLERRRPIDLLPDRNATTVANWLRQYPSIEIVTRDRSGEYARGIRDGAPQAIQVADRWQLLVNLREALERVLSRVHARLRTLPALPSQAPESAAEQVNQEVPARPRRRSPREEARKRANRERRQARYEQIKALHTHGLTTREIATRFQMSRTTVIGFLRTEAFPERAQRRPVRSILDPYEPSLRRRWAEGCQNGVQLWRELQAQGFRGSRTPVSRWVPQRRTQPPATSPIAYRQSWTEPRPDTTMAGTQPPRVPAPRRLVWLLLRPDQTLLPNDQALLRHLLQEEEVARAYDLGQEFARIVKTRNADALDAWLAECRSSGIEDLVTFATGLQQDHPALKAALTLEWSNAQLEGHVNRLKMLKRQSYGRAGFDLLRRRVLYAA